MILCSGSKKQDEKVHLGVITLIYMEKNAHCERQDKHVSQKPHAHGTIIHAINAVEDHRKGENAHRNGCVGNSATDNRFLDYGGNNDVTIKQP